MAFNFIVEIGEADPDANSYASVEFADDYVEANVHASEEWLDLEEEQKQRLLARSSQVLDIRFNWNGQRIDPESGLKWPRANCYDQDGYLIPDDVIPRVVKQATVEFAVYLMRSDWTVPGADGGSGEFSEIKVDVIQVKFKDNGQREGVMPEFLLAMLEGLGEAKTGRRPGFKRIVRS